MLRIIVFVLLLKIITYSAYIIDHHLVKLQNNTYLLLESDNTYIKVPDETTASIIADALHMKFNNIELVSAIREVEINALYTEGTKKISSLQMYAENPDEVLRVKAQIAEIIDCPERYWIRTRLLGNYMNPSLVHWHNKTLLIYRESYSKKVIRLIWMQDNMKDVDRQMTYLGIGPGQMLNIDGNEEDPRGFVLSNGALLITYGSTTDSSSKIRYVLGDVDNNGNAFFTQSKQLKNKNIIFNQQFEKNWIAFEYNKRLYYFTHINPPTIVTQITNENLDNNNNNNNNIIFGINGSKVETVYGILANTSNEMFHKITNTNWIKQYGDQFRGGTPAIRVPISESVRDKGEIAAIGPEKELLLAFFHTNKAGVWPVAFKRHTYFMGLIAFCPRPPFNILMTSEYPIMKYKEFYTGKWLFNTMDYVIFPAGIILKPKSTITTSNSSDPEYDIFMTMGHQDQYGYINRFDLNKLLSSLQFHSKCDPNPIRSSNVKTQLF